MFPSCWFGVVLFMAATIDVGLLKVKQSKLCYVGTEEKLSLQSCNTACCTVSRKDDNELHFGCHNNRTCSQNSGKKSGRRLGQLWCCCNKRGRKNFSCNEPSSWQRPTMRRRRNKLQKNWLTNIHQRKTNNVASDSNKDIRMRSKRSVTKTLLQDVKQCYKQCSRQAQGCKYELKVFSNLTRLTVDCYEGTTGCSDEGSADGSQINVTRCCQFPSEDKCRRYEELTINAFISYANKMRNSSTYCYNSGRDEKEGIGTIRLPYYCPSGGNCVAIYDSLQNRASAECLNGSHGEEWVKCGEQLDCMLNADEAIKSACCCAGPLCNNGELENRTRTYYEAMTSGPSSTQGTEEQDKTQAGFETACAWRRRGRCELRWLLLAVLAVWTVVTVVTVIVLLLLDPSEQEKQEEWTPSQRWERLHQMPRDEKLFRDVEHWYRQEERRERHRRLAGQPLRQIGYRLLRPFRPPNKEDEEEKRRNLEEMGKRKEKAKLDQQELQSVLKRQLYYQQTGKEIFDNEDSDDGLNAICSRAELPT